MNMLRILKETALYLWQLPQNIVGLMLLWYYKPDASMDYEGAKVYFDGKFPSGISLGRYIILKRMPRADFDFAWIDIRHEYGHHRQSLYLGPLYLLLIGLPSLLGNIYDRVAHKDWPYYKSYEWYYSQPWEHWADKLGGVNR